ncbi:MAG: exodeoxyribonuclease V subunit gamma, partial [Desulfoplanes sp.]
HFDQYLIFRPDMIRAWERGETCLPGNEHELWQASLWRELAVRLGTDGHRTALTERFLGALAGMQALPEGFPKRISVFGISSLPPMYLGILNALGRHVPVNNYLLSPCSEYWADIVSLKEKARLAVKHGLDEDAEHLETGNDLLASLGRLGRDFQDLLIANGMLEQDTQVFVPPGDDSLLHEMQGDILRMENPPAQGRGEFEIDDSVCIASCHSPLREMEALHDHLLARLEQRAGLKPEDIVVMCPDIGTYAPYIQAVFGARRGETTFIPFHIADQTREQEHPAVKGFFQVLDLTTSRFEASLVLSLLDSPFFREKAGMSPEEVDMVRAWVTKAGINWGTDEGFKRELGLPGYRENTWIAGIERMLLGLMMPVSMWRTEGGEGRREAGEGRQEAGEGRQEAGEGRQETGDGRQETGDGEERLAAGSAPDVIVPFDLIEGGQGEVLGRFVAFLRILFFHVANLDHPRSVGKWREDFRYLVEDLMQAGDVLAEGLLELVTGIEDVFTRAEQVGFADDLDFPAVCYLLKTSFADGAPGTRFLSGGVTFCTLQPMRSIPFSVMCLVGLSDGAFPRQDRSPGFDLIRAASRKGDRSLRMDDRYLFLEALISARDEIYFSYVGQDVRDNATLPPCVLLSEVMDYLDRYYPVDNGNGKLSELLTIKHRLQGFHPSYFEPDALHKSYVRDNLLGAVALLQPRILSPFIQDDLPEQELSGRDIRLDDVLGFWKNPARFLVQHRLGITLCTPEEGVQDVEPLEQLDSLVRYLLGQNLMHGGKENREDAYVRARGTNLLPQGTMGRRQFDSMCRDVDAMRARAMAITDGAAGEKPLSGTIVCGSHDIQTVLGDVYPQGQVLGRFAKAKGKDFLDAWIHHLVLQLLAPSSEMRTTWMVAQDGFWRFEPLNNAKDFLEDLLALFDRGHNECLHFFPESSHAFAKEFPKNIFGARTKARTQWQGSDFSYSEKDDVYFSLCFRDVEPLDETFEKLAAQVFGPIVDMVSKEG